MMNFFQFAPDDKSLQWLGQIFGNMNGVIPGTTGTGAISILGTMFKTFNTVVLSVAVLMVVYITVVGVMMSAQEGEFMGKKWNSLWVPVRVVLGIAALVPTGTGYCGLQIVMMWAIVQGVGAADTLWNTALSYANITGSVFAQIQVPAAGASTTLQQIFSGVVCDETARIADDNPTGSGNGDYYCNKKGGDKFCGSDRAFAVGKNNQYSLGPQGSCGVISLCNADSACKKSDSLECLSCKGQLAAMQNIIPTFRGIAQLLSYGDLYYRQFLQFSGNPILSRQYSNNWGFIYSYCSANGGSQKDCYNSRKNKNAPAWPAVDDKNNNSSTSQDAVNSLFWPYKVEPAIGNVNYITTATTFYVDMLEAAVTTYIAAQGNNPNNLSSALQGAQSTGWILAGSYFYMLAGLNGDNIHASSPDFGYQSNLTGSSGGSIMSNYRNDFSAASYLISVARNSNSSETNGGETGGVSGAPTSSGNSGVDQLKDTMGKTIDDTSTTLKTTVAASDTNPLARVATAGLVLLVYADVLFTVFLILSILLGFGSGIAFFVLGTGALNPTEPALILAYFLLAPVVIGLLALLVSIGGMLGIYTPLVPYVIFTFGAIGWFISTIEAMVAGPLVALGIISPAGPHEIMGKAEPALLLLFNIFLRPSLMVFGLIAAMLLASVVIIMINTAFGSVMLAIGTLDPLGLILFLAAYMTLIVTALNKAFSPISVIPEKVIRWIGGHGEGAGEEAAFGEVKRGVEGAASGAGRAMSGAKSTGEAAGAKYKKAQKENEPKDSGASMTAKKPEGEDKK